MKPHHGRRDIEELPPGQRAEAAARAAGAGTAAPEAVIRQLLGEINTHFYKGATAKQWLQDEKALLLVLTWPATWLNQRAIGLPVDRYVAIFREILATIATHGSSKFKHFPTYLDRCVRLYFVHNGEELYEERKRMRSALDLRFLKGLPATTATAPDPMEAIAAAHRVLASGSKRRAACQDDPTQPTLF